MEPFHLCTVLSPTIQISLATCEMSLKSWETKTRPPVLHSLRGIRQHLRKMEWRAFIWSSSQWLDEFIHNYIFMLDINSAVMKQTRLYESGWPHRVEAWRLHNKQCEFCRIQKAVNLHFTLTISGLLVRGSQWSLYPSDWLAHPAKAAAHSSLLLYQRTHFLSILGYQCVEIMMKIRPWLSPPIWW